MQSTTMISNITNLFTNNSSDEIYMSIKAETKEWHKIAKIYWSELYNKYQSYLDIDFASKFSKEFFNRLWELTLVNYLALQNKKGIKLISTVPNRNICKPDFCFTHDGTKFFIEATCASTGNPKNYPNLNYSFEEICGKTKAPPINDYRERLTSSLREKIACKYDPQNCDCKKSHSFKSGYKDYIESSGLIIAVSMAHIPFYYQPFMPSVDISCLFPCSPFPTIEIPMHNSKSAKKSKPYHQYQFTFNKGTNGNKIMTDYFANNKYNYISGVIISYVRQAFFPDIDQYEIGVNWKKCRNDFLLIHNPFAVKKLPYNLFPVAREAIVEVNNEQINIKLIENPYSCDLF